MKDRENNDKNEISLQDYLVNQIVAKNDNFWVGLTRGGSGWTWWNEVPIELDINR